MLPVRTGRPRKPALLPRKQQRHQSEDLCQTGLRNHQKDLPAAGRQASGAGHHGSKTGHAYFYSDIRSDCVTPSGV